MPVTSGFRRQHAACSMGGKVRSSDVTKVCNLCLDNVRTDDSLMNLVNEQLSWRKD